METFKQQVVRHLRNPNQITPQTLIRAPGHAINYLLTKGVSQNEIYRVDTAENYAGIEGLDKYRYLLRYPFFGDKLPREIWMRSSCTFLIFPQNSKLRVYVTEPVTERSKTIHTNDFINRIPDALASFTGPTVIRNLPNNGFYARGREDAFEPFEDTNPSGKRRGAIAIRENEVVELVDDTRKWEIVRNNFSGYKVLSGTSFYFTDKDTSVPKEFSDEAQRTQASYLLQYQDEEGKQRLCFMVSDAKVTRLAVKGLVDRFVKDRGGKSYMALELDLTDSNCVVKTNGKAKPLGKGGFTLRRDHYVLEMPSQT